MVYARLFGGRTLTARLAPLVCAAATWLNPSAGAEEDYVGGYALLYSSAAQARDAGVNRADFMRIGGVSPELALGLDGRFLDVDWRIRLTAREDGDETHLDEDLQELAWRVRWGDRWLLTLGKTQLQWDVGQSMQPLGFFQRDVDFNDPTDALGRSEGLPLAALTYLADQMSFEVVYSDDTMEAADGFNRGMKQGAARVSGDAGSLSWALIARWVEGSALAFGASAAVGAGDDVILYGSIYAPQGSRRPIHRFVLDGAVGLATRDPNGPWRTDDDGIFVRATTGVSWAPAQYWSASAELSHDEAGLDDTQWRTFRALVGAHRDAFATMPGLALANLAWDSATLARSGARRSYAFARISWARDDFSVALSTRSGLADRATLLNLNAAWAPSPLWRAQMSATQFLASEGGEFDLGVIQSGVSVTLQRRF